MGSQASWHHGLTMTRHGRGQRHRRRGWVGLSHSLSRLSILCLASHSHFPFFFFSSFFLFFFLVFLLSPFGVGLLTTESWECVCVCVFLIDLPRSWALGLAGWWAWGVHDFWEGPELKTKGARALFFFFWKFYLLKKKFWARAPLGSTWVRPDSLYLISSTFDGLQYVNSTLTILIVLKLKKKKPQNVKNETPKTWIQTYTK